MSRKPSDTTKKPWNPDPNVKPFTPGGQTTQPTGSSVVATTSRGSMTPPVAPVTGKSPSLRIGATPFTPASQATVSQTPQPAGSSNANTSRGSATPPVAPVTGKSPSLRIGATPFTPASQATVSQTQLIGSSDVGGPIISRGFVTPPPAPIGPNNKQTSGSSVDATTSWGWGAVTTTLLVPVGQGDTSPTNRADSLDAILDRLDRGDDLQMGAPTSQPSSVIASEGQSVLGGASYSTNKQPVIKHGDSEKTALAAVQYVLSDDEKTVSRSTNSVRLSTNVTPPPVPPSVPQIRAQSKGNTTPIPQLQLPPANTQVVAQSPAASTGFAAESYSHYEVIRAFRQRLMQYRGAGNDRSAEGLERQRILAVLESPCPLTLELLQSIRTESKYHFDVKIREQIFKNSDVKAFYALMMASNVFAVDIRDGRNVELAKTQLSDALTILEYFVILDWQKCEAAELKMRENKFISSIVQEKLSRQEFNDPHIPRSNLYCLINALRATLQAQVSSSESGSYFDRIASIIGRLIDICSTESFTKTYPKEKLRNDLFAVDDVYTTSAIDCLIQAFADAWKTRNATYIRKIQELLLMITEKFEGSKDLENSLKKEDRDYIQKIKNLLDKMNVKKGNSPEAFLVEADIAHELNEIMKQRPLTDVGTPKPSQKQAVPAAAPVANSNASSNQNRVVPAAASITNPPNQNRAVSTTSIANSSQKQAVPAASIANPRTTLPPVSDRGVILQHHSVDSSNNIITRIQEVGLDVALREYDEREDQRKTIIDAIIKAGQFDELFKSPFDLGILLQYCDIGQCEAIVSSRRFDQLIKSASDLRNVLMYCDQPAQCQAVVSTMIDKGKCDGVLESASDLEIALSRCNGENRLAIICTIIEKGKLDKLKFSSYIEIEVGLKSRNQKNGTSIYSAKIEKAELDKQMRNKSASHVEIPVRPIGSVKIAKTELAQRMSELDPRNDPNDIINTLHKILFKPLRWLIAAASRNNALLQKIEGEILRQLEKAKPGEIVDSDDIAAASRNNALLQKIEGEILRQLEKAKPGEIVDSDDIAAASRNNALLQTIEGEILRQLEKAKPGEIDKETLDKATRLLSLRRRIHPVFFASCPSATSDERYLEHYKYYYSQESANTPPTTMKC